MALPHFHMPGGYHFDGPQPAGPALSAGLFRTPASPSASSSVFNLAKSTGSVGPDSPGTHNTAAGAKRKRNLVPPSARSSTPLQEWASLTIDTSSDRPPTPSGFFDYAAPKVATSDAHAQGHIYTLAGQIETPGTDSIRHNQPCLEDSVYSDVDYRRRMGSKRSRDDLDSTTTPSTPTGPNTGPSDPPIMLTGVGDFSFSVPPNRGAGWGSLAFGALGGVVGRVWQFCKAGAFRGFSAGGGSRYPVRSAAGSPYVRRSPSPSIASTRGSESKWGPDLPDYHRRSRAGTPDSLPRHAVKRRQTSENTGEDLKNWVVVSDRSPTTGCYPQMSNFAQRHSAQGLSTPTSRTTSRMSSRRVSAAARRSMNGGGGGFSSSATTLNMNGRTTSRVSHAGSPALSSREPASFATPRSPVSTTSFIPVLAASPSRIPVPSSRLGNSAFIAPAATDPDSPAQQKPATPTTPRNSVIGSVAGFSPPGSRGKGNRHARHSSTSPRRKQNSISVPHMSTAFGAGAMDDATVAAADSPRLDPEARKLAAKRAAAEREADARMEALNAQLRQMIRQGREALGTRVTVEDDVAGGRVPAQGAWVDADD